MMANDDFPRTTAEKATWAEALSLAKGAQGANVKLAAYKRFDNLMLEIRLTCEAYGHDLAVSSNISLHELDKYSSEFVHFEIIHNIKCLVFSMNDMIKDYAFEHDQQLPPESQPLL